MTTNTPNNLLPELQQGPIADVVFRELKTVADNRGFFREVLRRDIPQVDAELDSAQPHSLKAGTVCGWRLDENRAQWWYVPVGRLKVGLYDTRPASATFGYVMEFTLDEVSTAQVAKIPAGVAFNYQAMTATQLVQFAARVTNNNQDTQLLEAEHPSQQFRFSVE